jgi:LemA protein
LADWLPLLVGGLVLGLAITFAVRYNGLVRARIRTQEAWSGIDVQLQRRADLVPSLVATVKGYTGHESRVFEEVARARGAVQRAATPIDATAANLILVQALSSLFGIVEAYPDLKASANFRALMTELSDVEEKIAFARQFYNMNVLALNTKIQTLPDVLYAGPLGFLSAAFYDADAGAEIVPQVRLDRERAPVPPAPAPPAEPPRG